MWRVVNYLTYLFYAAMYLSSHSCIGAVHDSLLCWGLAAAFHEPYIARHNTVCKSHIACRRCQEHAHMQSAMVVNCILALKPKGRAMLFAVQNVNNLQSSYKSCMMYARKKVYSSVQVIIN